MLGPDGAVTHIVHRVEDVTELVRLRAAGAAQDRLARDQQAAIEGLRAANTAAADAAARERASEARTRAILAHLPGAAAFVVDRDLRYILAAGEALGAAGVAPDAFVGRTMREAVGPALADLGEPLFRRALAGEAFTSEHEQGGRAFLSHGGPLRDADGRVEAALAVSTDVTEHRAAEAAVRASEVRYRALATASADVLYRMSPDWAAMRQLDGRGFLSDTSEPNGEWLGRYIHPDDQAQVMATVAEAIRTSSPFALEHRVIRADGTLGWTSSRAVPVLGAAGEVVEWIGAASDVTARKEAEAALKASEARYRTLFDSIDEGFCVVEVLFDAEERAVDYRFLEANPAFVQQTGLAGAVGRTMRALVPAHEAYWFETYGRVARTGEPTRFEAPAAALGRWYDVYAFRVGAPHERRVAILFADIGPRKRAEAALRVREAQFRAIVEGARDYAIVTTDPDGCIESWSPGAEATFGWTAAEAVGMSIGVTFTPEDQAADVPARERATAAGHGVAPDVRWHACKDGSRVFIDGTLRALRDERGRLRGFLKVAQDVTARRRLDDALRASEARFRTLVDNVRDYAIFLLDAAGVVTTWSAGAERLKGYTAEEAVGLHLSRFYAPEDVEVGVPERHLAEAAAAGRGEWEGWRVRRDGTRFWANEIASAVHDGDGRVVGFTKISRDLTERRLAAQVAEQAQLATARDELRRALAVAEEGERQRLARELHDQLGQELTAFRLGLDDAARLAADHIPANAPGRGPLLGRLAQLGALAGRMTAGARSLALELRPPELDDLGLESALETYVAEWGARYGVAADLAITGALRDRPLPADVGSTLYRVVQEALTNVAKHAGARQVSVVVEKPDGEVRLIVEDDGRGFDVEATATRTRTARRLGLAGMRERAALVGGSVAIESTPGAGTTLYVRLPLDGAGGRPAEDA